MNFGRGGGGLSVAELPLPHSWGLWWPKLPAGHGLPQGAFVLLPGLELRPCVLFHMAFPAFEVEVPP